MKKILLILPAIALLFLSGNHFEINAKEPVPVIFDTDMGNDVDDALALAILHAFHKRGECDLLGITITKDNRYVSPYLKMINRFYGHGDIPVGSIKSGIETHTGPYIQSVLEAKDANGKLLYADFDVSADKTVYMDSCKLLRKLLAGAKGKVVVVQVGFSTNLARLLDTKADEFSPLSGKDLMKEKVEYVCAMAGGFGPKYGKHKEYNIVKDIPAAQKLFAESPVPILCSGFEVGMQILYPGISMINDYNYVANHPVKESFRLYRKGFDKTTPTWDLTCVLQAVRPNRGYFGFSEPGTITVKDDGTTVFEKDAKGLHRLFTVNERQVEKVLESFIDLASEPPKGIGR
ncbi:MAG: nucleoside hydrolase [Planctomycetia bacterium]|nr:nucleoside hydrolase [Planctomycetia bacterium]